MIPVDFGDWPGRIVFGKGAVGQLAGMEQVGGRRALVLCGASVVRSGLPDKVKTGLGGALADVFPEVAATRPSRW